MTYEEALEKIKNFCENGCTDVTRCYSCELPITYLTLKKNNPVVRGEWKLHKDGSGTCNVCGTTQKAVWDMDSWQNFCGHCGAEMKGAKE